jgi:hypothetical protein
MSGYKTVFVMMSTSHGAERRGITRKVGIGNLSVSEEDRGRIVSTSIRVVHWRYSAMRSTVAAYRSQAVKVQHGPTTVSSDAVQIHVWAGAVSRAVVGIPTFFSPRSSSRVA